jgi:predicted O-methyltransferase YrrM
MNFLDEDVSAYLRTLCDRFDEPVLIEMEELASERKFPIVGRVVGAALAMLTRSIQARTVFELGSGFGFSAYWFARAVGPGGQVFLTDTDADNTAKSRDFLTRAGLASRCQFLTSDAVSALQATDDRFDIIYCDIDKEGYPEAFRVARDRIRPGGYFLCDNVLWSGRVARDEDDPATQAIRSMNQAVYSDMRFLPTIIPIRDGVLAALRVG